MASATWLWILARRMARGSVYHARGAMTGRGAVLTEAGCGRGARRGIGRGLALSGAGGGCGAGGAAMAGAWALTRAGGGTWRRVLMKAMPAWQRRMSTQRLKTAMSGRLKWMRMGAMIKRCQSRGSAAVVPRMASMAAASAR